MNARDILLVDDDADYLRLLSIFLEMEGFNVIMAQSGMKALEMLNKQKVRLLFTDLQIPDMNGLDLAIKVREHHADIIVFLMTSSSIPDIIEAATFAGISTIFKKPLNLGELVVTIKSSLHLNQAAL